MFDDEAWDEERWEAFLREHDKRVDRYTELLFRFLRKQPQPDPGDAEAFGAWRDALRRWLRDKGWRREDVILPFFWFEEERPEEEREAEEGFLFEGALSFEDPEGASLDELEHLPLYIHAHTLSMEVLDWAHALSSKVKDSHLVHFCSYIAQIPAHLARGHGIGYERDTVGGNIACVKRGLADANAALAVLGRMKGARYMDDATYRRLYEQVYEVRNELGLSVQELRGLFDLGID